MINISFWGSPAISARLLEVLLGDNRFKIQFAVSQPDKPRSRRGREVLPSAVKKVATEADVPVFTPTRLKKNQSEILNEFKQYPVDFHVILAYGRIIPEALFDYPEQGAVNFHASLLPLLRGAAPIEFSLYEGLNKTGWSLQRISKGMDEGDVYSQSAVDISWQETTTSLYEKLTTNLLSFGPGAMAEYAAGGLRAEPQNHEQATYCPKITTEMGQIDWQKSCLENRRQAQAFGSRPGIFSFYNKKKIKLTVDFEVAEEALKPSPGPAKIEILGEQMAVGCSDKALIIKGVQFEGKKAMTIRDFVNGYQVKSGQSFDMV